MAIRCTIQVHGMLVSEYQIAVYSQVSWDPLDVYVLCESDVKDVSEWSSDCSICQDKVGTSFWRCPVGVRCQTVHKVNVQLQLPDELKPETSPDMGKRTQRTLLQPSCCEVSQPNDSSLA